jgi:hypothetical protein
MLIPPGQTTGATLQWRIEAEERRFWREVNQALDPFNWGHWGRWDGY